jgi:hypothetical protein
MENIEKFEAAAGIDQRPARPARKA